MSRRSIVVVLVVTLLIAGVIGFAQFRKTMISRYLANIPEPAYPVSVSVVKRQAWTREVDAIGVLKAANGAVLASQVSGLVLDVKVDSGTSVKRGKVIAVLDHTQEDQDLRAIEAQQHLKQLSFERTEELRRSNAVSQEKVEEDRAALQESTARAESLRAQIAKKIIRAPFDGELGILKIHAGDFVQVGQPIVNLQNLGEMWLTMTMSQKEGPLLSAGLPVSATFTPYPDRAFNGTIFAVDPSIDDAGLLTGQARFSNEERLLRPGLFAEAKIQLADSAEVVVVPKSAISYALYGDVAYTLEKDDSGEWRARRKGVTVGEERGSLVEVLSGLSAGDTVVASGQLRLSDNAKVRIVKDDIIAKPPSLGLE